MAESFLDTVSQTDPLLLQQLKADADKLVELRAQMLLAEETFKAAEKAYSEYATKVLPEKFHTAGMEMLGTSDGLTLRIALKTRASIKKGTDNGASAKKNICDWLRAHNSTDLIREECVVPVSQIDKLREAGITFREDVDVNTNSLKALIVDMLGQKGSPAIINKDDLPQGLSFYQWEEVEVQ